jgi:hypothetical protein
MDFIHKFIPKNPINASTQSKITESVKHAVTVFAKNYALQTQLVIVGNKELEYRLKEERKAQVDKDRNYKTRYYKRIHGEDAQVPDIPEIPVRGTSLEIMTDYCTNILNLGFKPLFPRGKMEPLKPPELRIDLDRYVIRDSEYDPYAAYVIKTSMGPKVVEKERRFKEFEKLHKTLKKLLNKDCVLPPASSKIGIRNLTDDFLNERVKLLNEYLQQLKNIEAVVNDEAFTKFVGLYEEDPLDVQIFEAAFRATKYDLWVWGDIKYDDPTNAMSKLITREVWKSVSHDVYAAVPTAEAPRRASLKLAYKVISAAVDAAVPPAWNAAYEASKKVRGTIQSALDKVIGTIIEKKNDFNNQIKNKMMTAFEPIKDGIGKLFSAAVHKIVPPIIGPFAFLYKTYAEKAEPLIIEALKICDKDRMKEGTNVLNKIHQDMMQKLNDKVDEQLKTICEELNGLVSLRLLQDCFNPMKAIGKIIGDFVRIINPENFSEVAIEMFEYKTQLSKCNGQGVDKILVEMERNVYWRMDWNSWHMDNARYDLRYHIYRLGLDLDAIADVCFDLGKKLIKQVYRKTMKKFYRKFSDYVWGFSMKNEDDKPWHEKVNDAMIYAYKAAKHKFNKECGNIVKRCVCDILGGVIINKVIEMIIKTVGELIKTLTSVIPEAIKEMIDLESMAKNDIEEVLRSTFEGAVYEQNDAFVEELNKAIENCQLQD